METIKYNEYNVDALVAEAVENINSSKYEGFENVRSAIETIRDLKLKCYNASAPHDVYEYLQNCVEHIIYLWGMYEDGVLKCPQFPYSNG